MQWYEPLAVKWPNLTDSRKSHPSHWDTHRKIGWPLGTWQRRVVSSYHDDMQLFSTAMGESTTEYIQSLEATTIAPLISIPFYVLNILSAFFTKLSKRAKHNTNPLTISFSKKKLISSSVSLFALYHMQTKDYKLLLQSKTFLQKKASALLLLLLPMILK